MDEKKLIEEILVAVDEFLIYRTDGKLQELSHLRNKLRRERQETEDKRGYNENCRKWHHG